MISWFIQAFDKNDELAYTKRVPRDAWPRAAKAARLAYLEPYDDHNCGEHPLQEAVARALLRSLGIDAPRYPWWYLGATDDVDE